jgi:hypothetical protein
LDTKTYFSDVSVAGWPAHSFVLFGLRFCETQTGLTCATKPRKPGVSGPLFFEGTTLDLV